MRKLALILSLLFCTSVCNAQLTRVSARIGYTPLTSNQPFPTSTPPGPEFRVTIPASATHIDIIGFNKGSGSANLTFSMNLVPTTEQNNTPGSPLLGVTYFCTVNPNTSATVPVPAANFSTPSISQGGFAVVECPAPSTGIIDFTITSTSAGVLWDLGVISWTGPSPTTAQSTTGAVVGATAAGSALPSPIFPVVIGGTTSAGNAVTLNLASGPALGALILGLVGNNPVDASTQYVIPSTQTGAGTGGLLVAPTLYNGTTADTQVKCPTPVAISVAAAATQQLVAPVAGRRARICSMFLTVSTAGSASFTEGTGGTCAVGTTTIGGPMTLPVGMASVMSAGTSVLQTLTLGDGFCITSTTAALQGWAQVESH